MPILLPLPRPSLRQGLLLVALLASGCGAESKRFDRWTDLLRKVDARIEVRNLASDRRPALVLPPGPGLSFGPLPGGQACRLRLSFAASEAATADRLEVGLRSWSESRVVFDRDLEPGGDVPSWYDLEIDLGSHDGPFHLDFAVLGQALAIASPHTICSISRSERRSSHPDVLFVSIDTLRRDRLGIYGYHRPTSPALDAFAREALIFDRAFAVAPWTLPSHASMFTGLYPDQHGAGHASDKTKLGPGPGTLAEWLAAAGYRTVGISAGGYAGRTFGLDRGFEHWIEHRRANLQSSLPAVMESLSEPSDRPLFLFLHTFDVHAPYEQPVTARRFTPEPLPAEREARWRELRDEPLHAYLDPEHFHSLADLDAAYDAGVAAVDTELAKLFAALGEMGRLDHTLVVITSDHGESLLEHGDYVGHSFSFHEEELAIPLIVRFPGASPAGRWADLVDHTDLAPLILRAAGVSGPELSGRSPLDRREGRAEKRVWVRGGAVNLGALYARNEHWLLITPPQRRTPRARRVPPGIEARFSARRPIWIPLSDEATRGEEREELARALAGIEPPGRRADSPTELDEQVQEQLRALGYLNLD